MTWMELRKHFVVKSLSSAQHGAPRSFQKPFAPRLIIIVEDIGKSFFIPCTCPSPELLLYQPSVCRMYRNLKDFPRCFLKVLPPDFVAFKTAFKSSNMTFGSNFLFLKSHCYKTRLFIQIIQTAVWWHLSAVCLRLIRCLFTFRQLFVYISVSYSLTEFFFVMFLKNWIFEQNFLSFCNSVYKRYKILQRFTSTTEYIVTVTYNAQLLFNALFNELFIFPWL